MLNKEQYLLTLIQEECAELSQRASKALRFGLYEVQPGQELNNWERLKDEAKDLFVVLFMLDPDLLKPNEVEIQKKQDKVEKYMRLSQDRGILEDEIGSDFIE